MRISTVQAAHTYGVLDPLVVERRDTKFVGQSLSDGANIIILPQGGWRGRGGTLDFGRIRRLVENVPLDASITAMPNGGTEADLLSGAGTTIGSPAGAAFVLVTMTFPLPETIHFFDVAGVKVATTGADDALYAQWWDGAAWQAFGARLKITTDARSRRLASGAPGHAGHTSTQFRIVHDATIAAGDVTIRQLSARVESIELGDGVIWRFEPEQGLTHQLVVTPNNIDVFTNGTWRAAIAFPATTATLREIKPEARYDTILAFHQDMQPQRITYMKDSAEWSCDVVPFRNAPLVDYGGVYTGIHEVQQIRLLDIADTEQFTLTIEGQTTDPITKDATPATTAADIKTELEALPNIGTGLAVTVQSGEVFNIKFSGAENGYRQWAQMFGTALNLEGVIQVFTVTQGKTGGEAIISAARGWPAVGRFVQQRLVMSGMKSKPNGVLGSVTGDPFDLNTELESAVAAFAYDLEAVQNSTIRDIVAGRTILFIGDAQIVYLKNAKLSAAEVPDFGTSDAPGIKRTISPVASNNAIYYVDNQGATLQIASYSALEENLVGDNASVLSAFLIKDPVDLTRRRATAELDADLQVIVNADGTITALTTMRSQEISGFAPWTCEGAFKSAEVDHANQLWLLVERQVDGQPEIRLELHQPGELLDEAVLFEPLSPQSTFTGLERFNGRQVWAIAGEGTAFDQVLGPFAVTGGAVTLSIATQKARFGSWRAPLATDPPVMLTEETRARMARLKRVNRAEISVHQTTSIAIRANDGPVFDLPPRTADDTVLDEGPLKRPFTGKVEAEGMHGFTEHGRLTVTQTHPGHITVRSVTKNVAA